MYYSWSLEPGRLAAQLGGTISGCWCRCRKGGGPGEDPRLCTTSWPGPVGTLPLCRSTEESQFILQVLLSFLTDQKNSSVKSLPDQKMSCTDRLSLGWSRSTTCLRSPLSGTLLKGTRPDIPFISKNLSGKTGLVYALCLFLEIFPLIFFLGWSPPLWTSSCSLASCPWRSWPRSWTTASPTLLTC